MIWLLFAGLIQFLGDASRAASTFGDMSTRTWQGGHTHRPEKDWYIPAVNAVCPGLPFEGSVLTYDPTTNGAEWVPM